MTGFLLVAAVGVFLPTSVLAHAGEAHGPVDLWRAYSFDAEVLVPMLVFATVYISGIVRLWHRAGPGRGVRPWRVGCFAAGMLALSFALIWPLDALGGFSFAAHMAQHVMLTVFAAPLLVLSAPVVTALWALPPTWRRSLGTFGQGAVLRGTWGVVTLPIFAWFFYASMLWLWHMPTLYQAAVLDELLHTLEHLLFFISALLLWWTVLLSVHGKTLGLGAGIFLLFTTGLQEGLLGALLTFSQRPLYAIYDAGSTPWGLAPLADQQIAGILMWIPGGMVYLLSGLLLTNLWLLRMKNSGAVA